MSTLFTICLLLMIIAVPILSLQYHFKNLETLEDFTAQEKTILRWQLLATIPAVVFSLAFLLNFMVSAIDLPLFKIAMLSSVMSIVYISVSSIKNRVSLLTANRRQMEPTTGSSAVIFGIIMLIGAFALLIGVFIFLP